MEMCASPFSLPEMSHSNSPERGGEYVNLQFFSRTAWQHALKGETGAGVVCFVIMNLIYNV